MTKEIIMEWLKADHRRSVLKFAKEHDMKPNDVWDLLLNKTP